MSGWREDLRLALRAMVRQKGFTAAALVSLALGLGGNTALFSAVYGVLLRPLPYPEAERLVRLSEEHPGGQEAFSRPLLSNLTFHAWRDSRLLEGLAGSRSETFLETRGPRDSAVRVRGASVSPALFALLGLAPAAGRFLVAADADPRASPVVVLAHRFWQERFGGDPSAVGGSLTLGDRAHTIVGVASPDFYFPDREALLWTPLDVPAVADDPATHSISVFSAIGRLRKGVTRAQAEAEGTAAARSLPRPPVVEAIFGRGGPVAVRARNLLQEMTGKVRPALLVLTVASGFVLLIACANFANLLLARGVVRARELAVGTAIGASRSRLVRQLLVESVLLSLLGGVLGLALAGALLRLLPALAPSDFPRLSDIRLDGRALAFAASASLATGLVAGILPALRASYASPLLALSDGSRASAGAKTLRLGGALLAAEAALAVMMLVSAGLLVRSFVRLLEVDAGYDPSGVVLARVYLPDEERPAPEARLALVDDVLARLRAAPGVEAAGAGNMAPFVQATALMSFAWPDPGPRGEQLQARAVAYVVTPGFAEALVGVVGNVLKNGLDTNPQSEIYTLPGYGFDLQSEVSLAVRASGDLSAVARALPAFVREREPTAAVEVATLASRVSSSVAQPRFAAATLAAFALLALTLAATGLYGVLSYNVAQRKREMGVRSALGASRGDLVALVLRQGLGVTAAGLVLGLAGAGLASRALEQLLFGITPTDAVAFAFAPALLFAVAFAACMVPARRAAATDPAEALRVE